MEKNKTGKYFKYAIAEILLVMVGILLAVQINNWNENRKSKIKEINIAKLSTCENSNEIIIYHIENNIPYNDSLNYHFSNLYPYITFNINQTTYENLKQTGLSLISNDSLRLSISDLYANRFMNNSRNKEIMFWTAEMCKTFIYIQSSLKEDVEVLIAQIDKEIDD